MCPACNSTQIVARYYEWAPYWLCLDCGAKSDEDEIDRLMIAEKEKQTNAESGADAA